ncbi:phage baseplate assembly protein V [Nocardia sp. NPDC127579]|uniref:phage baseplate assembly protein V n=1 Tax=Nocardia sp. NPDC127579 TaxID=3345402 RepID=UPI00362A2238
MLIEESSRHVGRYYGKYRATVLDNADAQHRGMLEVEVLDVFGAGVRVSAEACLPYGTYMVPPVGAGVFVEFEAGNPESPLWTAVALNPDAQAKVSADTVLIKHTGDALISIDEKGGVLLSSPAGSYLHLDAANESATLAEGHGNFIAMGEKGIGVINAEGAVVNVTGDTVHIRAAKVVLEATSIALGAGATDTAVLGSGMEALWTLLVGHVHPPGGPSPQLAVLPKLIPGVHLSSSVVVK